MSSRFWRKEINFFHFFFNCMGFVCQDMEALRRYGYAAEFYSFTLVSMIRTCRRLSRKQALLYFFESLLYFSLFILGFISLRVGGIPLFFFLFRDASIFFLHWFWQEIC